MLRNGALATAEALPRLAPRLIAHLRSSPTPSILRFPSAIWASTSHPAQNTLQEGVQEYYGSTPASSADLRPDAAVMPRRCPPLLRPAAGPASHPEVLSRYYGAAWLVPELLFEGCRVLDLGAAAAATSTCSPSGGVRPARWWDRTWTPQQLEVAEAHRDFPRERFGYANVSLSWRDPGDPGRAAPVPASFDLVVSNCVVIPLHRQAGRAAGGAAPAQARWRVLFRRCLRPTGATPKRLP